MLPEPLLHDVTGGSSLGYPELERGAGLEDAPGAVAAGRLRTGVALGAPEAVTGVTLPAGDVEGPASANALAVGVLGASGDSVAAGVGFPDAPAQAATRNPRVSNPPIRNREIRTRAPVRLRDDEPRPAAYFFALAGFRGVRLDDARAAGFGTRGAAAGAVPGAA